MASMDNLRDKIRSRRADTSELNSAPTPPTPTPPAPGAAPLRDKLRIKREDTGDLQDQPAVTAALWSESLKQDVLDPPLPGKQSNTDSLISEIFSEGPQPDAAPAFHAPKKQTAEPKARKTSESVFLKRFKHLEVNRKMLLVSLGVAALASFLSMAYLKGIAEPLKGKSKMVKVITLTQDVPARTELTEKMLEIKEVPVAYLPEGVLEYQPNLKLLGQVTLTGLYKGEVIHTKRISLPNQETGITTVIPEGHRAMTIRTNNAGLINPSTRDRKEYIDLMATIPDPNPVRRGRVITLPMLQRAMVLAVGNQLSTSQADGASAAPSGGSGNTTITLAVPEDRVSLMVMLEEKGDFKVIPRSPDDTSTLPEKYTVQEIEDALQGKFEAVPAASESTPEPAPAVEAVAPAAPAAPLVDLSGGGGGRAAYRAPARRTTPARAPARTTARAPVRRAAPVRTAPKPAARPAARPAAPAKRGGLGGGAPFVVQGGNVTQGGN
ncbi:MAG: Flp pilus assembly protein CpaB [Candidatus Sericytochromatia bacterium]